MDIDPEISNWVLEFLLRQPLEDGVLNSLLRSLPLSNNNAHLKKMILLRKIDSDLSGSSISESTLEVFEKLEEIEFQQGREAVSDAMKRAHCAVAVECTVQPLADNGDGGTDSRKLKFFEVVKRVWKGRIGRMEKMVEKGGLGSDELWRWKDEMEAAVWEDSVFEGVVKKTEGVNAVEAVRAYMREEKEKMGPSFLEMVADSVKEDEATPGGLGVESGKEGLPASFGDVSSVDMGMESDIGDDGQPLSSDPPPISSARRKSGRKSTRISDIGDDDQLQSFDQPQSSDQPTLPISSARRKSVRKPTHMSDIGDDVQLQSSEVLPISSASKINGRKSSCMTKFILKTGGKVKVHFDSLLDASGPNKRNADNFISYLGFLGRKLVSILANSWKDVSDDNKENIWQGILDKFEIFFLEDQNEVEFSLVDVKKQNKFKKKWLSYVGRRWACFKTNLVSAYIYGNKKGQLPYEDDYPFLDADTWDAFVASRLTEEFKAKRENARRVQAHNKCPQRCSRGGYKLLKQKIMEEKYKARQEALEDPSDVIPPPSPPSRHEAWKRARISADGKYTTPEASIIGEKIACLEEQQSEGSFRPLGRNDILAVATGRPDKPGFVRGVGKGYTIRDIFGKPQCRANGMVSREEFDDTIALMQGKLKAEMMTMFSSQVGPTSTLGTPVVQSANGNCAPSSMIAREEFDDTVALMQGKLRAEMMTMFSSQVGDTSVPGTPVVQSAKGSCAPVLMAEDLQEEHDEYELFVEDPHRRLVAYGQLQDLGSIIHHKKLKAYEVRVTVVRVVDGDALVPLPTDEVTTVREAPKQFITWPRRLVQNVTSKEISQPKNLDPKPQSRPETSVDALKLLWVASADITEPKYMCMEAGIVGEKADHDVYINQDDIMGLLLTRQISVSVMQFYNECLHNVLKLSGRTDKYGLTSPLTIKNHAINEEIGVVLRKRIVERDFECFLVPIYEDHWHLMVLCPKYNVVTWFCPMGKKQKRKLSEKIETAFEAYQVTKGKKTYQSKKPQWVYPKCYLQKGSAIEACGFFVMRLMLEIIKLDTVNSFEKALDPEEFYSKDSIDDVRRCWAERFLEVTSR